MKKKTTPKKAITLKDKDIVVHNPVNPSQSFIVASETADDQAIEDELMGKAMEHYVYSFLERGATVTGLTVAGVNEMSRQLTKKKDSGIKIRIIPDSVKIERDVEMEGKKGVLVTLFAENMISAEIGIGVKFEPYKKQGKNGQYENTFALEKAVSKAERNAKRKLIPEKLAIETIKKFVKINGTKQIEAPKEFKAPYQAPIDNPEDIFEKVKRMISTCKSKETLFSILEQSKKGKNITASQKKSLETLISQRVEQLDK